MDIDKALGQFMGKKIPKNKTKTIIGEIYSKHQILYNQKGVTAKLNQETIKEYYDVTPQNKEKPNKWKIKKMKPEIAELINKE